MYVKMRCISAGKIIDIVFMCCLPRVITLDRTYGVDLRKRIRMIKQHALIGQTKSLIIGFRSRLGTSRSRVATLFLRVALRLTLFQ